MFELPKLPYEMNGLSPYLSEETLNYHYGKHHQTYVTNLNNLVKSTEYESMSLEAIIKASPPTPIFNNAAQVYNHSFYFLALALSQNFNAKNELGQKITQNFGSLEELQSKINQMATANFGSGWTWLALDKNSDKLEVINTSNAANPLTDESKQLLLCVDVWEHAYYIDYRNSRPEYLKSFWSIVNWRVIEDRYSA